MFFLFCFFLPVLQMDSSAISPFLLARDAYRRWVQQRDACLRMVEERLSRSRLRSALTRLLTTQALADARAQADCAACALANVHGDHVFAPAGFKAPTDVFFGPSLRMPDGTAGPRARSPGNELGLPEVLMLVDLEGAATSFLQSVQHLPGLPSARKVSACARRFKADYDRAMSCLKEQRLACEAGHACSVYFRKNMPADVGARVIDFAY